MRKYVLAMIFTLCVGGAVLFYNVGLGYRWVEVSLVSVIAMVSVYIAEKGYKKKADLTFKKYPCTNIGIIVTAFSELMAIIQLILK